MTLDHALIDELLAIRALDGLDEDDAALLERELAAHGDCDECRRLEVEHAEVAGMLALALDPRPVDENMADRILAPRTGAGPDRRPRRPMSSRAAATFDSADGRRPSASRRRSRSSSHSYWRRVRRWRTRCPSTIVAFEGAPGRAGYGVHAR